MRGTSTQHSQIATPIFEPKLFAKISTLFQTASVSPILISQSSSLFLIFYLSPKLKHSFSDPSSYSHTPKTHNTTAQAAVHTNKVGIFPKA